MSVKTKYVTETFDPQRIDGKHVQVIESLDDLSGVLEVLWYGDTKSPAGAGKGTQDFGKLKASLAPGQKFLDPHFPANEASLGALDLKYAGGKKMEIEWRRPHEIAKAMFDSDNPIFHGPYDQFGVNQGTVGDCWFLAVLADIARYPDLINTVVPTDNAAKGDEGFDKGIFHFRFWFRGNWIDVVVDDQLPCIISFGEIVNTAFTKPTKTGGFWAPLLEKAYAKLYGNYNAIAGGFSVDAMKDFTGGLIVTHAPHSPADWEAKVKQYCHVQAEQGALLAVGTIHTCPPELRAPPGPNNPGNEAVSKEGIVCGHAYTLLGCKEVTYIANPSKKVTLIKLRNPWGNETEWNGPFCDKDTSWSQVTPNLRADASERRNDGEFYMPVESMFKYQDSLHVCTWNKKFRGVYEEIYNKFDGTYVCQYPGIIKNSGTDVKPDQVFRSPGYFIHLTPSAGSPPGHKPGFMVNMLYKNYKKSGNNPNIPSFGVLQCTAPGHLDEKEFVKQCRTFQLKLGPKGGDRDYNEATNLEPGTMFLVPWTREFEKGLENSTEIVFRVAVEGDVKAVNSLL